MRLFCLENDFSSVEEKVSEFLRRIEAKDKTIKAFIDVYADDALETARLLDKKRKSGHKLGRLFGMVFAIKNNICIKGKRVTCASKMLENYIAPYDATVIEALRKEDAVIIGSVNMDEFACGVDCTQSAFFPTRNPLDLERVPGGSSGGSAAAVAAGFCDAALGSDTGGSVRCPAAFCSLVGVKPTYGSVSRYGLVDMAMSLDQIGPLTSSLSTTEKILKVIAFPDPRDNMCNVKIDYSRKSNLRFGYVREFFEFVDGSIGQRIEEIIAELKKHYEVIELTIPILKHAVSIYYLCMCAELSSALQRYDGLKYGYPADVTKELVNAVSEVRGKAFGKEIKRRILIGTYITMKEHKDSWYKKSLLARELIRQSFAGAFNVVDVIIGPTVPRYPWKIGEKMHPLEMYQTDILTVNANLAGIPAISIPLSNLKLPAGLQIHAPHAKEGLMFGAAELIEKIEKEV